MDDDSVTTDQRPDHSRTPVLEALERYRRADRRPFSPPGHKGGVGVDARVALTLGPDVFASDVLALNGLDDRRMSGRVLERAEELMADAVDADRAYFSTCGSSLSVKASMLAVAGPGEKLLVARNAHKSVIAGVILAGIEPVWVRPRWDAEHRLSHPPGPEQVAAAFERAPDAKGMLLVTPTAYGRALRLATGVRTEVAELPGLVPLAEAELTGPGRAFAYDPLLVVIDVSGLGTSGYAAVEWLREHHRVDLGLGDHRRVVAQLTHADTVVEYLGSGVEHGMYVPDPSDPELRTLRVVAR